MFAVKSAILFALFSLLSTVVAVPPGCLLAGINTQKNPVDLDKICGDNSEKVQHAIVDRCDDNKKSKALKAFAAACKESGNKVSLINIKNPSSSSTSISSPTESSGSSPSPTSGSGSGGSGSSGSDSEPSGTDDASAPEGTNAAYINGANSFTLAAAAALAGIAAAM